METRPVLIVDDDPDIREMLCLVLEATLVAPCERGNEQPERDAPTLRYPERDAPTLRYLDELTSLFEDLSRIVAGMF